MFGWLADLLVKSPVIGSSCSCCEAQKEHLKKMQRAILDKEEPQKEPLCSTPTENDYQEMHVSYRYRL